ncbi:M20/M25/M40 family metallo-hydrolase [Flavobacteriales bacterium]|nr:M20/M25/M40 family metallo-hydrolase [Flavobacteriales bacterium]
MKLLKKLCSIHAPSGEENNISEFIIEYVNSNMQNWKVKPKIYNGDGFQDSIILSFGKPKTAIYAHMDSIGFTVKYNNEIIKIGGPVVKNGIELVGSDSKGKIEGKVIKKNEKIFIDFNREIDRGTSLTFKMNFKESNDYIQSCYLDNRLGVWNALKVAEKLENGIIVFSCWEEHGGGSVGFLTNFIYTKYNISQALISDITWVTEGVKAGVGVAISLRDSGIPRKKFVNKIIDLAKKNNISYQLEVESSGGSDGNEIQKSPFPVDWCFIGAAEQNVHSPKEKVHKDDIKSMVEIYDMLMKEL